MFACVSKSNADLHETLTTLQYAMRARAVQNKVVANVMTAPANNLEDSVVEALRLQLKSLQSQLEANEINMKSSMPMHSGHSSNFREKATSLCSELVEKICSVQNTISVMDVILMSKLSCHFNVLCSFDT